MNKALVIPVIALFGLFAQRFFNIQFSDQDIQIIVDGLLSIITLIGIFTNPKKPE